MPAGVILSSIVSLARALYIGTLLMLTSPAWFFALSKVTSGKCTTRTLTAIYVGFMASVVVTYLIMELIFRICLRFENPLRSLDRVIGVTLINLALYALIGVGLMVKFHVYYRRVEVALIFIASIVPAVNGCLRIAKNVFNDQTCMIIQGIEALIYILILFTKASMSLEWEVSQVQNQTTEASDIEEAMKGRSSKDTVFLPWNVNSSQTLARAKSANSSQHIYKSDGCKSVYDISTPTSSNMDPFEYDITTSVSMRKDSSKVQTGTIKNDRKYSIKAPRNIKGNNIPLAVWVTQADSKEDF
ncbi:hypothetical protein E3P86_04023 [Wallemia ichthyophaga]|uniref:Uncharacterized protein n=1 Tax=Wallemia ichthyophaga TaxID=245174 RepID=A0A4T0IFJ6_WALIC|nr:hypothetical protein E3P86_04023 [Wallemia ichthyophaga]